MGHDRSHAIQDVHMRGSDALEGDRAHPYMEIKATHEIRDVHGTDTFMEAKTRRDWHTDEPADMKML